MTMQIPAQPWWKTDDYHLPGYNDGPDMGRSDLWGPRGPAVVRLFPDGKTDPGWGEAMFMGLYNKLNFSPRKVLHRYDQLQQPFAWVMRGMRMICVDIDGKNGRFEHASELGYLPPTIAEKSMSGNGYHLFYEVDDTWDSDKGFARYRDTIGLVTGVDIRGVGCVYHKPTQKWNDRAPAQLPEHLSSMLLQKQQRREIQSVVIQKTLELDETEVLMLHMELLEDLAKPIPAKRKNQTLFAIGTKLKQAQAGGWDEKIRLRGEDVNLDQEEIEKLIRNIENYGG